MAHPYVDLADFKADTKVTDTVDDDAIERALNAASEWIDGYCGRAFDGSVTETRYFLATDTDRLDVPDLASVTTLKVDAAGAETFGTTLAATDYDLLPLNVGSASVLGKYQTIVVKGTSSKSFRVGYQVQIVGTWGYGSIPESIKQACILLANRLYKRLKMPFGTLEAPETGEIFRVAGKDADVLALLDRYKAPQSASSWVLV